MAGDRLIGKVALVTAGGSGMGRRSCIRMAEEGAHVIVTDLDGAAATAVAGEISGAGGAGEPIRLDIRDLDELRAVADRVTAEHGALHVLFNHAGMPGPPGLEITPEQWSRTVDVNVRGAFFLTSYLLGALRAAQRASIIYTSSGAGLVGSQFSPLYSLVKGGLVNFTRAVALNLAADGIRANAICPGSTDTPMLPGFFAGAPGDDDVDARKEALFASIPLRRLGTPDDVAEAAVFLASDASSYITGVALPVDGGYTAR
jgi:NAD(P)-dependent dehydrogenase (short-subunit alcohol dehydrogenase family)